MSKVTPEMVEKALASLDANLGEEIVSKASENDLDQPEGADLGNPAKEKMSDEAKAAKAKADVEEGIKKGKEEKEPASEEESEEGEGEGEDMALSKKAVKKSELPEEIQTKIDVSEFLKSLVEHTTESIDELANSVLKSEEATYAKFEELSKSVAEVVKSQAKIGLVLKALCEQAGILASAPKRVAKSETTVAKSAVAERSFAQEPVEAGEEKMFKSLSDNPMMAKSQITEALIDLVKSNKCTDMDLINFESTSYLRPEIVEQLKVKLN